MRWIDTVLSEFARVTWQQWFTTIIGGIGLAWLAELGSKYRRGLYPTLESENAIRNHF